MRILVFFKRYVAQEEEKLSSQVGNPVQKPVRGTKERGQLFTFKLAPVGVERSFKPKDRPPAPAPLPRYL